MINVDPSARYECHSDILCRQAEGIGGCVRARERRETVGECSVYTLEIDRRQGQSWVH